MNCIIALFGESEKGRFHYPYFFTNLNKLAMTLGNPPKDSLGIYFAIQAIMYEKDIFFFRVEQEGFSIKDYMKGLAILKDKNKIKKLDAICMPKVGNSQIIDTIDHHKRFHNILLITTERDLFDYLC